MTPKRPRSSTTGTGGGPRAGRRGQNSAHGNVRARTDGSGTDRTRRDVARREGDRAPRREPLPLDDDVVRELNATARPGKGPIAVKVFGEAAAAFAEGAFDDAARLADQCKHIALRSAPVRELLGLSLYRLGRYRDAARELSAFRRMSGTVEQNPVLADCYRALGRTDRALELCDEVAPKGVSPAVYFESQIVAAGALADDGRLDDAIARLERLDLDSEVAEEHHLRAWYALGDLLERRGRFTTARRLFDAVASTDPGLTDAPERAARLADRRGNRG